MPVFVFELDCAIFENKLELNNDENSPTSCFKKMAVAKRQFCQKHTKLHQVFDYLIITAAHKYSQTSRFISVSSYFSRHIVRNWNIDISVSFVVTFNSCIVMLI